MAAVMVAAARAEQVAEAVETAADLANGREVAAVGVVPVVEAASGGWAVLVAAVVRAVRVAAEAQGQPQWQSKQPAFPAPEPTRT